MDWNIYLKIPTKAFITAKEIGLAPATLLAMGRKGLIEVKDTSPKTYRRINSVAAKAYYLCDKHANEYETYFMLNNPKRRYGMLCSIISDTICDCWGNPLPLSEYTTIQFGKKKYDILTGKEIL